MLRPIHTTFDRSAIPTNLLTVAEWRTFARAIGRTSWEGAARYYAARQGGALVMKADDSLVCFTRLDCGGVRRSTYKPGSWSWERPI